ncbi:MAG: dihydrolipoyl dehydrogenase family protein [Christensenellales bacterium]|jgi:mycothione reductase
MKRYDIAVIGSGAGLMVVEDALERGLTCAIIEQSKFGGTCLTRGCIPSKMLVYPADLIREARDARRIGVGYAEPAVDWSVISQRVWTQIGYHQDIENSLRKAPGLDIYKGQGAFTGANRMRVSYADGMPDSEFEADRFVIAAGARSFVPPIDGLEDAGYLTSESFFGDQFPEKPWNSLIIIGGGAIGAEFAHIFSAFGTQVTIVEMKDHLIPTEEEEVSEFVMRQFDGYGIRMHTGARARAVSRGAAGKSVEIEDVKTGERRTLTAEEILVSSGVRSNADRLNLAAAGVATDARGWIETNAFLETSQPHIFAIGDINGKYQFRHTANYEATVLSENMFDGARRQASYDSVPWAIFTHPQVGHVGMTECEARAAGLDIGIARNFYSEIAGGISMGISEDSGDDGFAKILLTRDMRIVGAHIVGPYAAILVQPFVYLMNAGEPCAALRSADRSELLRQIREICPQIGSVRPVTDSMVIHPSMNELAAWAIEDIVWDEA